jgi:hypothetical protein
VDFSFSGTQYFVHYATSTPLTTGFSLGFWVAVDTTVCPTCQIIQVQDQMQTANTTAGQPAIPNTSTASVTHNPGSPATVNLDALNAFDQSGLSNMGTTLEKVMFTCGSVHYLSDDDSGACHVVADRARVARPRNLRAPPPEAVSFEVSSKLQF